jgi:hypothetical protein
MTYLREVLEQHDLVTGQPVGYRERELTEQVTDDPLSRNGSRQLHEFTRAVTTACLRREGVLIPFRVAALKFFAPILIVYTCSVQRV